MSALRKHAALSVVVANCDTSETKSRFGLRAHFCKVGYGNLDMRTIWKRDVWSRCIQRFIENGLCCGVFELTVLWESFDTHIIMQNRYINLLCFKWKINLLLAESLFDLIIVFEQVMLILSLQLCRTKHHPYTEDKNPTLEDYWIVHKRGLSDAPASNRIARLKQLSWPRPRPRACAIGNRTLV